MLSNFKKRSFPIQLIALLCFIVVALGYKQIIYKTYGQVIILNGPSSSGKSSIQKAFQELYLPHCWAKLGIDQLLDKAMPDVTAHTMHLWQTKNSIRWVTSKTDAEKNPVITLHLGTEGEKIMRGMNAAIAAYAKAGCNVIVDYIAYDQSWIEDLKNQLQNIKTTWIKVCIPLEVLEERERIRGTSPVGHARSHYHSVYDNIHYNLTVNSAEQTPQEIATHIKNYLDKQSSNHSGK